MGGFMSYPGMTYDIYNEMGGGGNPDYNSGSGGGHDPYGVFGLPQQSGWSYDPFTGQPYLDGNPLFSATGTGSAPGSGSDPLNPFTFFTPGLQQGAGQGGATNGPGVYTPPLSGSGSSTGNNSTTNNNTSNTSNVNYAPSSTAVNALSTGSPASIADSYNPTPGKFSPIGAGAPPPAPPQTVGLTPPPNYDLGQQPDQADPYGVMGMPQKRIGNNPAMNPLAGRNFKSPPMAARIGNAALGLTGLDRYRQLYNQIAHPYGQQKKPTDITPIYDPRFMPDQGSDNGSY